MKKTLLLSLTAGVMVMFSGCATIMSGDTQQVSVNSNVPNLKFKLNGQMYQTPAILTLKRGKNKTITVDDGKCKQRILLNKKINPIFFVNILSGGAFGSTTDYITGDMWKYDDQVNINCSR